MNQPISFDLKSNINLHFQKFQDGSSHSISIHCRLFLFLAKITLFIVKNVLYYFYAVTELYTL